MKSLRQFFSYLNDVNFQYIVLRNWDNLPDTVEFGDHSDLDLLVYDLEHFKEIIPGLREEFPFPRVRHRMPVGDEYIFMDIRYIGDGYYPADFESEMLSTRVYNENGFYTPDPIHHTLALAYHVVHHKNHNSYQKWLGECTVGELLEALKSSTMGWVAPIDQSVGRFNPYWKGATSIVDKTEDGIIKQQTSFKGYNLIENEYRILSMLSSKHFPRAKKVDGDKIEVEDCGEHLTLDNLPKDWNEQLVYILSELRANNIIHRDIKPDNLMVKGGIIKLIDFGWARLADDKPDNPPSNLGYPYKPSWGWDDNFSMRKVIKEIEYKLSEKTEETFK